jgi:hypothetical protein
MSKASPNLLTAPHGYRVRPKSTETDAAIAEAARLIATTARRERLWGRLRSGKATTADRQRLVTRLSLDARHEIAAVTARLIDGSLSRPAWEARVRAVIAPRLYAGILASIDSPTAEDMAEAHAVVAAHLGYLKRFRTDLATGQQALDGRARTRADLYGAAVWTEGQNAEVRHRKRNGFTQYRARLGPADHCKGCLDRAAKGWQKIGTLPPLGDSPCRSRCHCRWNFRKQLASQGRGETTPPTYPATISPSRPSLGRRIAALPGRAARAIGGAVRRLAGR